MPNERGSGLEFGEDDEACALGDGLPRQSLDSFKIAGEIKGSGKGLNGRDSHGERNQFCRMNVEYTSSRSSHASPKSPRETLIGA